MKIFKTILKVFVVIIFVVSAILNILIANSSYGSLLFKYEENKFLSLNTHAAHKFNYILSNKNEGLQFKATSVEGCDEFVANYYLDENSNLTFETKCTYTENDETVVNKAYFKDDVIYLDNNGTKSKESISEIYAISLYKSMFTYSDLYMLTNEAITSNDSKTKIGFSFSPFYLIGINYSYKSEDNTLYKYSYDLTGKLRKVTVKDNENESKMTFNYKNKKIDFPSNLESY